MTDRMRAWPARLKRVIANAWIDLHYRRLLMGIRPTHFAHLGAKSVSNSDYEVLQDIFAGRVKPDDVLVDAGCDRRIDINTIMCVVGSC